MTAPRRTLWTLLVVALVAVAVAAVGLRALRAPTPAGSAGQEKPAVVEVPAAQARVGAIRTVRELPATAEPTRLARLASPAEGPVTRLLVREGDVVKAAQLLVVIGRSRTARARLFADREELRKVQDELDRVERLVAKGALAGELVDRARADVERAKAMVEGGEEAASDYQIRAPWPGIVSEVLVQEGNYVAPRAVLLEIFDPASMVLRLSLPESLSFAIAEGAAAQARFDAWAGKELGGRVSRLFPELDRKLRTRTIELELDEPASLAPGMFARVRLTTAELPSALLVPSTAVLTTPAQEKVVFVVVDGVAHRRLVTLGLEDESRSQIASGIEPGELVVTGGHAKITEGTRVQIKSPPSPAKGSSSPSESAPSSLAPTATPLGSTGSAGRRP